MKRLLPLLFVLYAVKAFGQTGTVLPTPVFTAFDNSGNPVSGAKLCVYISGTTTASNTYTDSTLGTLNANPVIMNAAGRNVAGGIFLTPGKTYKFELRQPGSTSTCADGTIIWSQDGVAAIPTSSAALDVLGTAGESILAGQVVYLSDGSGSKTAGQWFKADNTTAPYSNTLPIIGVAPSAITISTVGTVRLAGQVTGLSGLTIGLPYYVSTAGTMTLTAPANPRLLGSADSTTSLLLTSNPAPITQLDNALDDFRCSLTTALAVTTADVTGASAGTIFLTPYKGNRIALYDASGNPSLYVSPEVSVAVPASTSQMYDVFAVASSGSVTIENLAWTNDTTRATAIVNTVAKGVWTKTGDATRRYVCSFRTTTVANQTEDSFAKRFVWNYYNRVTRPMRVIDATATWTYTTAAYQQARAQTTNQLAFIVGVTEDPVWAATHVTVGNSASNVKVETAIGDNSTMTPATNSNIGEGYALGGAVGGVSLQLHAYYETYPAVGYHPYMWLEKSEAASTTTWYGSQTNSGIFGEIQG